MEDNDNTKPVPKIKPFLIGIAGGNASGKCKFAQKLLKRVGIQDLCMIRMDSYSKDLSAEELSRVGDYNFEHPVALDFDLISEHLTMLRHGQEIEMPVYNSQKKKREKNGYRVKSCPLIICVGNLTFYDKRIRNMMDLKLFVDTDDDIRLARRIFKDRTNYNKKLLAIISQYHKFIKPTFEEFVRPTRKYADIVIPRGTKNIGAIDLISQHLLIQLNKVYANNTMESSASSYPPIFLASLHDIIDPHFQFMHNQIQVPEEIQQIETLKQIFEDFITKKEEVAIFASIFVDHMVNSLLSCFQAKIPIEPIFDLVISELDENIDKVEFSKYKTVVYFKTCILSETDLEIPERILKENVNCRLFINSIFLAPKFAEIIINIQSDINPRVVLTSLYFSDFFIKYEYFIKTQDSLFFSREMMGEYYWKLWKKYFP